MIDFARRHAENVVDTANPTVGDLVDIMETYAYTASARKAWFFIERLAETKRLNFNDFYGVDTEQRYNIRFLALVLRFKDAATAAKFADEFLSGLMIEDHRIDDISKVHDLLLGGQTAEASALLRHTS